MQSLKVVEHRKPIAFQIHDQAMLAARDLKNKYLHLFETLIKAEAEQIYLQFEVPSLYIYCVDLLELSPSIAKDFGCVIRKSFEVPELGKAVRAKRITISKARKICPVINPSNFNQWIELAANCSTRIIEKAVAQANPREAVFESLRYASQERLELKFGVSEEWVELLGKTKDLLSTKLKRSVSSEEALQILMTEFCDRNDPVAKAKRAFAKQSLARQNEVVTFSERNQTVEKVRRTSRYRPAEVENAVSLRDQNRCSYVDRTGKQCDSKRWLQKHHIVEFANGGEHSLANLETLCSGHHKMRHMKLN